MRAHHLTVDRLTFDRSQRLEDLELFVADDVRIERVRRLHGDEREELQQVVLHHVAQRAGLIVVTGPGADPFFLSDRDLHVVDVLLIEQRLEEAVGEAEHQDVLNGLLAEVVIDAVDLAFVEHAGDRVVDGHRAREVASDRLFDDHASEGTGVCGSDEARARELFDRRP